jgi:hypothetical protein
MKIKRVEYNTDVEHIYQNDKDYNIHDYENIFLESRTWNGNNESIN